MTPPDWKTCDEGELWRFVAWCDREGGAEAYEKLLEELSKAEPA